MFEKVKLALRVTTNAFDDEINDLIAAACLDMGIAGVSDTVANVDTTNALIVRAVITYCKMYFGDPSEKDFDRLKTAYDEQKAQMSMATGYTDWSVENAE